MMWTFAVALVVGSFSLAGIYFGLSFQVNNIKTSNENKNALQDLTIQTLNLNVQKIEIELKELQKAVNEKKSNETIPIK